MKASLNADQNVSAYCDKCSKFQYVVSILKTLAIFASELILKIIVIQTQSHSVNFLPQILAINCGLDNDKGMKFWKSQTEATTGDKGSAKLPDLSNPKKPCRYGSKCTRVDCKFSHQTDKRYYLLPVFK